MTINTKNSTCHFCVVCSWKWKPSITEATESFPGCIVHLPPSVIDQWGLTCRHNTIDTMKARKHTLTERSQGKRDKDQENVQVRHGGEEGVWHRAAMPRENPEIIRRAGCFIGRWKWQQVCERRQRIGGELLQWAWPRKREGKMNRKYRTGKPNKSISK